MSGRCRTYALVVVATAEYYRELVEAFPDAESLTVLVVARATREEVATALSVDLGAPVADPWEDEGSTGWAIGEVPGGVLAVEETGYGDPTRAALRTLSANGAAAVVRSNVQGHVRFGCATDGRLLFDDDEYMFIQDPGAVPAQLRPLFDLAWTDLDEGEGDGPDGFVVGLAMAEAITGVELEPVHVAQVLDSGYFSAPTLVYASSLND